MHISFLPISLKNLDPGLFIVLVYDGAIWAQHVNAESMRSQHILHCKA